MVDWEALIDDIKSSFGLKVQNSQIIAEMRKAHPDFYDTFYAQNNRVSG